MKKEGTIALLVSILIIAPFAGSAQQSGQYFYPIKKNKSSFTGSGCQWILDRADTSRFILFGEQHGVEGIAEFVDFMYRELHKKGFNYLLLESDPWTTQRATAMGVDEFSRQNPHSIAFDTNGDLHLMQSAIDLNPYTKNPIWGVDQMQTAIHPFDRLVELAQTAEQRRLARGAYMKATLKMGRYTRQDYQKDLEVLEQAFASNPSPEKDQILKEIRQTKDIFTQWINPETRNASVLKREQLMGTNFDSYLKYVPGAKAVFKMGGAHTMKGIGPNGIPTFGEHVKKIAERRGQSILSIGIYGYNAESSLIKESDFGQHEMILLDAKAALAENPTDSSTLAQLDAIVYLKNPTYANKTINRGYEKAFRNRFIKSLIPLIIGIIIALITLNIYLIKMLRKKPTSLKYPAIASTLTIGLVAFQVFQLLRSNGAAISNGYLPVIIHGLLLVFSIGLVIQAIRFVRSSNLALHKVFFVILTLSFLMLSYCIYYWNIGGMLF